MAAPPARLLLAACALAGGVAMPPAARAAPSVDLALVLVSDVSRSIDDTEFGLEKEGYRAAFVDSSVLAAIRGGPLGRIAVSYVEFASSYESRTVVDWTIVEDAASAEGFAARVGQAPRSFWGRTSISAGVDRAVESLAAGAFDTPRRVIDVCGDGTNNAGREIRSARDEAVAAGIVVNGLAIINDHPVSWAYAHVQPPGGLALYYRENVAGGPGNFVIEIHDFAAFGAAMVRKLVSEIAGGAAPGSLARK